MNFKDCIENNNSILMEGALGERLKREYKLNFDEAVVMAGLVYSKEGRTALEEIWKEYLTITERFNLPFLATTPTRRVNRDRVGNSRYSQCIVKDNVEFLQNIQKMSRVPMFAGGLLGCKGDAYTGEGALDVEESKRFHKWEVELFAQSGIDFLFAGIIPTVLEAAGIALAIQEFHIPYIISFTIQKDGCLIDGTRIYDAITYIDNLTEYPPVGYMTNCVHPRIVYQALEQTFNDNDVVHKRFFGIQANTSPLSYAELDHSVDLKSSDPVELADEMIKLRELSPFKIFGGCCGTDGRHMEEIAKRIK